MKKLLLVILCSVTSFVMAQSVSTSVSPQFGCPNTTHDVTVSVTYSGTSVPGSVSYTITLNVKDDQANILKTFSGGGSGFANGETKTYTITDVPFAGPMTCTVDGSVSVPAFSMTIPIPPQNYIVQFPYNLTITENPTGTLNVSTTLDGYSVRYYLNANYGTVINESTTGTYTPTSVGDYTAKAISYVTSTIDGAKSCTSTVASNMITISIINSLEEAQNISISVYPNPVVSSVTIAAGTSSELTYELSDMNGAVVRSASFNGVGNINAEGLNAGSYILVIKNQNEKVASYKLVK